MTNDELQRQIDSLMFALGRLTERVDKLERAVVLLADTRAPNFDANWRGYADAIEAIRKHVRT